MSLDHAKQVKARHERELLMLDSVQGVSVGQEHGRPAIKIYVDKLVPFRGSLPKSIENVPVVVEETGPFRAF